LDLRDNQLTSVPAEIGQLISLQYLFLDSNRLTSVPAAVEELRAACCEGLLDYGVTVDE
jgi:leucine-rich repeat protein SHOC2